MSIDGTFENCQASHVTNNWKYPFAKIMDLTIPLLLGKTTKNKYLKFYVDNLFNFTQG